MNCRKLIEMNFFILYYGNEIETNENPKFLPRGREEKPTAHMSLGTP